AHAEAKKFDQANLLTYRLAPDMLPFTKQVQIACDTAKIGVARIAGMEWPKYDDNETTFAQLQDRIKKTLDFIETIPAGKLDGTEEKELEIPVSRDTKRAMKAKNYLRFHALPNFFFHVTTAYAILRHNGVDLGKVDYLAGAER
ncbi:MAG TPA: DUF1993 domain-containing protein, partial [Ramlibacter sp.]|nr:DUF1993 domain-containing protein [Ramlibacter sp.]